MDEKKPSSLKIPSPAEPQPVTPLRKSDPCPHCGRTTLNYNGLLQLECAACGFLQGEFGGCT